MTTLASEAPPAPAFDELLDAIEVASSEAAEAAPEIAQKTAEAEDLARKHAGAVTAAWDDLRRAIKETAPHHFASLLAFFEAVGAECDPPRRGMTVRNALIPGNEGHYGPEAARTVTRVALRVLRAKQAEDERLEAAQAA